MPHRHLRVHVSQLHNRRRDSMRGGPFRHPLLILRPPSGGLFLRIVVLGLSVSFCRKRLCSSASARPFPALTIVAAQAWPAIERSFRPGAQHARRLSKRTASLDTGLRRNLSKTARHHEESRSNGCVAVPCWCEEQRFRHLVSPLGFCPVKRVIRCLEKTFRHPHGPAIP